MRLIDADKIKECAVACNIHNGTVTDLCVPLYKIDNAPTIEPEITNDDLQAAMTESYHLGYELAETKFKRPQGEWKETGYETGAQGITYRQTQCSNCGWEHALPMWLNFCPNCGAKMEVPDENQV